MITPPWSDDVHVRYDLSMLADLEIMTRKGDTWEEYDDGYGTLESMVSDNEVEDGRRDLHAVEG